MPPKKKVDPAVIQNYPPHVFEKPVEIYPNVWLSAVAFTDDIPAWCAANDFTHLLNAGGQYIRSYFYTTDPNAAVPKYMQIEVPDVETADISRFFDESYQFIKEGSQNRVLIHCLFGQSRSVALAINFLMREYDMSYDEALDKIKSLRPVAQPNRSFEIQLRKFGKKE